MREVYLKPRGRIRQELRSDTVIGLLAIGVREVYGSDALDTFLAPLVGDSPEPPLLITSAFPFAERDGSRVHDFPRPIDPAAPWERGFLEDRDLLALVAGRTPTHVEEAGPGAGSGLFFLAEGRAETMLEGALGYLEQAGFGGRASAGGGAFDVELREAEFLRTAHAGELGLLMSLYLPTNDEASRIAEAAAAGDVRYRVCRRQGIIDRGRYGGDEPRKRAVVMMEEGSVLPVGSETPGRSPIVARADDGGGEFDVIQHGFGFFVPLTATPVAVGGAS